MQRMSLLARLLLALACLLGRFHGAYAATRIATNKDCYEQGEAIEVSFQTDNPTVHDWVAIVPSGTSLVPFPNSVISDWMYACGSKTCNRDTARGSGSLGMPSTPLTPGSWKVVLVTLGTGAWNAVAETNVFDFKSSSQCVRNPITPQPTPRPVAVPAPTTSMPTFSPFTVAPTRSRPLPTQATVQTNKQQYAPNEEIVVIFEYPDPQADDWVGIYTFTTSSSNVVSGGGAFWMWVCGGQVSGACSSAVSYFWCISIQIPRQRVEVPQFFKTV